MTKINTLADMIEQMVDINAKQKNEQVSTLNTKNIIRTSILMIKIFTARFLEKTEIRLQTNYPILSEKKAHNFKFFIKPMIYIYFNEVQ